MSHHAACCRPGYDTMPTLSPLAIGRPAWTSTAVRGAKHQKQLEILKEEDEQLTGRIRKIFRVDMSWCFNWIFHKQISDPPPSNLNHLVLQDPRSDPVSNVTKLPLCFQDLSRAISCWLRILRNNAYGRCFIVDILHLQLGSQKVGSCQRFPPDHVRTQRSTNQSDPQWSKSTWCIVI